MPGMDPACCARELCGVAGSTPIVLCTAAVEPATRAAEVGLSHWLAKPFELDALQTLVREAARQHEPAAVRLKPDTAHDLRE
jgi:CheY-like chemotaxis protein